MENPNIKKADLFAGLRKKWEKFQSPKEIIDDLEQFQPAFLALTTPNGYAPGTPKILERVDRLYRAGRPSSIFPFVLKLLRSFELDKLSEASVVETLDALESFLFRRAILGIEPTGLHAVFKGLWQELIGESASADWSTLLTAERLRHAIRSKATVTWPSETEFKTGVQVGELYRRKIAAYAIREYEISLDGETPSDNHQIEHIAPQTPTPSWASKIPNEYETLLHTWGNLLPLTPKMNPATGQSDFSVKREAYAGSIFASARDVAKTQEWNSETIKERTSRISNWALTRWQY